MDLISEKEIPDTYRKLNSRMFYNESDNSYYLKCPNGHWIKSFSKIVDGQLKEKCFWCGDEREFEIKVIKKKVKTQEKVKENSYP